MQELRFFDTQLNDLFSQAFNLSKDIKKDIRIIKAIKHFRLQEETINILAKDKLQLQQIASQQRLELMRIQESELYKELEKTKEQLDSAVKAVENMQKGL